MVGVKAMVHDGGCEGNRCTKPGLGLGLVVFEVALGIVELGLGTARVSVHIHMHICIYIRIMNRRSDDSCNVYIYHAGAWLAVNSVRSLSASGSL